MEKHDLKKIENYLYEIPTSYRVGMNVPARIYVNNKMLEKVLEDKSLEQAVNVATLPGIYKYSLAMPDIHQGYGFPIGGVAAFRTDSGIISPGGVGYDINCGVRLLKSHLLFEDIKPSLEKLSDYFLTHVPSGVGKGGKIKVKGKELDEVLTKGANWAVKRGYASQEDVKCIEESGCLNTADSSLVSEKAKKRGSDQLGTLGSGNHFLEVQKIEKIYDEQQAQKWGLRKNQITVMIHTGSRGLGHQVCTDYLRILQKYIYQKNIKLADRELIYAEFNSVEAQNYLGAMAAAANFAWANRCVIMHLVREVWQRIFIEQGKNANLDLLYDVAHNIAKIEKYDNLELCVHRKGATRAFPNQPVLIPGSMGTASYVLVGTEKAMTHSFGSVCHGAGRTMSRGQALRTVAGDKLQSDLKKQGITVRTYSLRGLAEEAPQAYKNIDDVVNIVGQAGLAKKIAKLKPIIVIKGD